MTLQIGQKAPKFSAKNHENKSISLESFGKKTIILYFYPKDMTKGCTTESMEFNALLDKFSAKNAVIVGVSPDSVESHSKFIAKENLRQMLLSDTDKKIAESYGVWGEKSMYGRKYMGIIRSTFVIQNGEILAAFYNVKSSGHAKQVLESLGKK